MTPTPPNPSPLTGSTVPNPQGDWWRHNWAPKARAEAGYPTESKAQTIARLQGIKGSSHHLTIELARLTKGGKKP